MAPIHWILIVEENPPRAAELRLWLRLRGCAVEIARNYRDACGNIARKCPDLILLGEFQDIMSSSEFLEHALKHCPDAKLTHLGGLHDAASLERLLSFSLPDNSRTREKINRLRAG